MNLPDIPLNAHVGILGGSFDPPHLVHQQLALCALALEPIDTLWVIPCADHPFAKQLSPFHHRLKMCELAFACFQNVSVLDVERTLPVPNYTVRTLEHILTLRPDLKLSLIMGSDVLMQLSNWHAPERLLQLCEIVVYLREGFLIDSQPLDSGRIHVRDDLVLPGIKSRDIRANATLSPWTDLRVAQYATENELYV